MTDVHTSEGRSYNMRRIRGKDTKPERIVRKHLFSHGFRYRLHVKGLPGRPDIVFTKRKVAIFVHGCFWHGHEDCRYYVIPKTRTEWWINKIKKTKERDEENFRKLAEMGWEVIEIWECQLKGPEKDRTISKLARQLEE